MIDTNAIRSKILLLALQGKLTEQLAEDGNAQELYDDIQKDKCVLLQQGKIKKEKPLPPITEKELPFEIPENWKWIRWGELSESIQYGYNAPAKSEGKIKMVRISDIQDGKVMWNEVPYCDIADSEIDQYILKKNDILFARTGGTVGKSYIVSEISEKAVFAGYLIRTSYSVKLCAQYMKYFMESSFYWRQLQNGTIATAQPNCNGKTLSKMIVPLPPYAEQIRIVDMLDSINSLLGTIEEFQNAYEIDKSILKDKLIDAGIRGKLIEHLSNAGKAKDLYERMVEEKKQILKDRKGREDKKIKEVNNEEVPYELPENWKWVRFGEIGLFKKDPFGSALTKAMFVPKAEDTVKVYEQQHAIQKNNELGTYYITREYFNEKMSGFEVLPGDIIVSCAGTIGETYILPNNSEQGIINQALMRVSLVPSVDKKFFQYYFDANLKKAAQDASNGSAIKNIPPFDVMKNWYFPLAPLKEQQSIVDKIDEMLSIIG